MVLKFLLLNFFYLHRQKTHKDSTTSRVQAPFERKLSTRTLQMSGDSIGSNVIPDRKMSRLEPEHAVRKTSQGFDTRSVVSMRSSRSVARSHSHMSGGSEIRDAQGKTDEDRREERIERFW